MQRAGAAAGAPCAAIVTDCPVAAPAGRAWLPLAVVILNWNLPADTIACVESVQRAAPADTTIVVVDNGSTDGSPARLRAHLRAAITLLALPNNGGFAAGMNAGLAHALAHGAQSVLVLNNDTLLDAGMLTALLEAAAGLPPDAGVLAPLIYYADAPQRVWRAADRLPRWLPVPRPVSPRDLAAGAPLAVDYVTGCALLAHRTVLAQVGLFDPRYVMYYEDADWCRRVRTAGWQIWLVPRAHMWHKVSLSARKDRPRTRYAQAWGRARFYRTHPHGPLPALTTGWLLLKLLALALRDIVGRDWHLLAPLWRGTLDGWHGRPAHLPPDPRLTRA